MYVGAKGRKKKKPYIGNIDQQSIEIIKNFIKGKNDLKWREFDHKHKAAYMKYYRKRNRYTIDEDDNLLLDGYKLIPREKHEAVINKLYSKVKGTGSRKLYNKIRQDYKGSIPERKIQHVLNSNELHRSLNAKFKEK